MRRNVRNIFQLLRAFRVPIYIWCKSRNRIKTYKDKYKGKRCFIIGNGPSLRAEDLDLLKNEITFSANRIFHIFEKTEWRPTFYCVQDNHVLGDMNKEFMCVAELVEGTFIRMRGYDKISEWYKEVPNLIFVPIWERLSSKNRAPFSYNADKYLYDGYTVTYMAMQLAVYMGFSEIYLLGVDHSFPTRRNKEGKVEVVDKNIVSHFYELDDKIDSSEKILGCNRHEEVTEAYMSAEEFSRTSGIFRIFNATRGGKLEVFERVRLEDVL